jgi:hypothetical protein
MNQISQMLQIIPPHCEALLGSVFLIIIKIGEKHETNRIFFVRPPLFGATAR